MALHNPPIDIPFVDLTTGMVTRPWQEWLIINKRDKANRIEDGTEDNLMSIDADGHPQDSDTSAPDGDIVGTTDTQELSNKTFAELVGTKILASNGAGGLSEEDLDDWVTGTAGRLTVTDDGDGTITLTVPLKANFGITSDANGLSLNQQTNIGDAVAVSATALTAGADTVNIATCNTTLAGLVTEINAIKDVVNAIIALLLASEIMAA